MLIYAVIGVALAATRWLNPGASKHIYVLFSWAAFSLWMDLIQAYEMKLFSDFFGFCALVAITLHNVFRGLPSKGEILSSNLAFSQVVVSALAYGFALGMESFGFPSEVFTVLLVTYGWVLNVLFVASILVLNEGVNIRDRVADFTRSVAGLGLRSSNLFASPKAHWKTTNHGERSA